MGLVRITAEGMCHLSSLTNLQYLNFSRTNVNDQVMSTLLPNITSVRELYLNKCKKLGNDTIESIAKFLPNLISLDIANISFKKPLLSLPSNCNKLVSLCLSNTKPIDDSFLDKVAEFLPNLKYLYLTACPNVTDHSIVKVAHRCTNMHILNLSGCIKLTDNSMKALAENCVELDSIYLSKCMQVTMGGLSTLLKANKHKMELVELGHTSITQKVDMIDFPLQCEMLTDFACANCALGDEFVLLLVKFCPKIVRLGIPETSLTDKGVSYICKGLPRVEWLNLSKCTQLTRKCIPNILNLKKLEILSLAHCTGIEGEQLEELPQVKCPLHFFQLAGISPNFSSSMAVQILMCFSTLKRVNLSGVNHLQEEYLLKYFRSENARFLEDINLAAAANLTDDTLHSICESCPLVMNLTLAHNQNYSSKCIGELVTRCKRLNRLELTSTNAETSILEDILKTPHLHYLGLKNTKVDKMQAKRFSSLFPHISVIV